MGEYQSVAAAEIAPTMPLGGSLTLDPASMVSPQPSKGCRLLWVDDSRLLLSLYKSVFENLGFEVLTSSSPDEALEHLSCNAADVAILDYDMPEIDGGMLASLIKNRYPMLPVILYSGNAGIPPSAHRWVDAICTKAGPREDLLTTIERLAPMVGAAHGADSPRTFTPSSNH